MNSRPTSLPADPTRAQERSTSAEEPEQTAIVFDVDGVIVPIGGPTEWGGDITLGDPDHGLWVSPAMCGEIDKLAGHGLVSCYWLTDWTQQMRRDVNPLPGRHWPELTSAQTGPPRAKEWAEEWWPALPWWKWWALDEWLSQHAGGRRILWIDDYLARYRREPSAGGTSRRAWTIETALRTGALVDVLLLAPDTHTGLRRLDLQILNGWILGVGEQRLVNLSVDLNSVGPHCQDARQQPSRKARR